jgi:hypothetical protein
MERERSEHVEKGVRVMKEKRRYSFITSLSLALGLFLILIGVVLLLWAQDIATWDEALGYFFLGSGVIYLLDTTVHYVMGPRSFMWYRLTTSFLFLSTGGAILGGIASWWPLIPILLGVGILLNLLINSMLGK